MIPFRIECLHANLHARVLLYMRAFVHKSLHAGVVVCRRACVQACMRADVLACNACLCVGEIVFLRPGVILS
jgi:hypothetical protein